MTRGLFGPGPIVLGGGSLLLGAFLAVGFVLPGTWRAEAQASLAVGVDELRPLLDSPEGWRRWTQWPDSGLDRSGPERGAGARIAWSSRELGTGSFRIDQVSATRVAYTVDVQGVGRETMRTVGPITLDVEPDGTPVRWRESGDLGRNPLMGYWALSMERAQSAEMEKSLSRLARIVRSGPR